MSEQQRKSRIWLGLAISAPYGLAVFARELGGPEWLPVALVPLGLIGTVLVLWNLIAWLVEE